MIGVQRKIKTRIGSIYIMATEKGIKGIFWKSQKSILENENTKLQSKLLNKAEKQLNEYFEGKRRIFDLPLDVDGTPFQKKVWAQLEKIPYGETKNYKQIAVAINAENASQAVGNANGKNPLCIIIPCHRVIPMKGGIGGYSGGSKAKDILLKIERGENF